MEHQEAYQRAKKRAEAKFGFYIHLSVYIAVSILLTHYKSKFIHPIPMVQLAAHGMGHRCIFSCFGSLCFFWKTICHREND